MTAESLLRDQATQLPGGRLPTDRQRARVAGPGLVRCPMMGLNGPSCQAARLLAWSDACRFLHHSLPCPPPSPWARMARAPCCPVPCGRNGSSSQTAGPPIGSATAASARAGWRPARTRWLVHRDGCRLQRYLPCYRRTYGMVIHRGPIRSLHSARDHAHGRRYGVRNESSSARPSPHGS